MAGSSTKSWWDYSRWMSNIGRNSRITYLEPNVELPLARSVLKNLWNPVTQTGTRPWMDNKLRRLGLTGTCDIDVEPPQVICKMVGAMGRDLKKIPMTNAEAFGVTLLIMATGHRYLGAGPKFGGVIGAEVAIP